MLRKCFHRIYINLKISVTKYMYKPKLDPKFYNI